MTPTTYTPPFGHHLAGSEIETAWALTHLADSEGTVPRATHQITNLTGLSDVTIRRAFRTLLRLGWIKTVEYTNPGGATIQITGTSNLDTQPQR